MIEFRSEQMGRMVVVFFGVLIVFAVVLTIIYVIVSVHKKLSNQQKPVQIRYATILEVPPCTGIPSMSYVSVLFQLDNGDRIRFVIKATCELVAGDSGWLKYQGDNMLSFVRAPRSSTSVETDVRHQ